MKNRETIEAQIKAAAWAAAAELGISEAVKLLRQAAADLENAQWSGR